MTSTQVKNQVRDSVERGFDTLHRVADIVTFPLAPLDGAIHGTARGLLNWITDTHPEEQAKCSKPDNASPPPSNQYGQPSPYGDHGYPPPPPPYGNHGYGYPPPAYGHPSPFGNYSYPPPAPPPPPPPLLSAPAYGYPSPCGNYGYPPPPPPPPPPQSDNYPSDPTPGYPYPYYVRRTRSSSGQKIQKVRNGTFN